MKILAIDTATERCSAALRIDDQLIERTIDTARGHADVILPMVQEILEEGRLTLQQLDGIAYGRGPGAFTGLRIAVGVAQGLAFGAQLLTVGVSNLAAVAQQVAKPANRVLVCMDARMGEVYWAMFTCDPRSGLVVAEGIERVGRPESVIEQLSASSKRADVFAGTGFRAHPMLAQLAGNSNAWDILPRAREIAVLGVAEFAAGLGKPAAEAQPIYIRDQVAVAKRM